MIRRALLLMLLAACKRSETTPAPPDAAPPASPSASAPVPTASASVTATSTATPSPRLPPVEARRAKVTRLEDDPALVAATAEIRKHFGGTVPRELAVQSVDRPEGRGRALLVIDATKPASDPFALAVDGAGAVKWTKERPAAGIVPPIGPLAIAAGPSGRVVLAVCDPPTTRVALRLWDEDGSPFADFDAMDMDDCTAVSVLYWPRRGWIVAASRAATTRAQLVSESGALAWRRGMDLGARTITGAPASLAVDAEESFVLVQYGTVSAEPGARPHALAFRYDTHGAPLWPAPVDLGPAPTTRIDDRIVLARPKPGVVHATLAKGVEVDVTSNGTVTPRGAQGLQ